MLRLLVIPIVLIALLIGAMTLSGGGTEKRAELTFINRGEVTTLDPNRMSYMQDIRVGYCLFEGLYTLDPKTLEAVPGCAEPLDPQRDISPDKTVYTFHIRPSARWNDDAGTPVTTADFVFAWRRMLEEPSEYTYLLHYIKGAKEYEEAYAEKKPADFSKVGIKALDSRTLQVTLNHPVGFFLDVIAFPCCFPLLESSMKDFRDVGANGRVTYNKGFTRPPHLVTNGPYRLASWEFKRRLHLEASKFYRDPSLVKPQTVDIVSADDPMWALTIYDTGGVDWLTDMTGDLARELLDKGRKDVHVFPAFGTYFYSFNCQEKMPDGEPNPFHDKRVRQAFSLAVNKKEIVDTITRLNEPVATQYIPPYAFEKYPSPEGLKGDVNRAKALLAEAGYGPGGKPFPQFSLLYNNESQHGPIAQLVRRQWRNALGVDVRLEGIEITTFRERQKKREYVICRSSWYGDYNDPSTFTDKYKSDSGQNEAGWKNPEYDRLCAEADRDPDPQHRLQLFSQAEKILLQEAPILPLYHYMNVYLFKDEKIPNMLLHSHNHVVIQSLNVRP
jgi:oligopeptide transport system substrate-binding protein